MKLDEPDKCFICHNESNLLHIKICCGELVTHFQCFHNYCEYDKNLRKKLLTQ